MPIATTAFYATKNAVASHMAYSLLSSSVSNHTINWKEELFAFPELHWWQYFLYGGICLFLVCFAGLCSGLTLGLLSIDHMSLSILLEAGTEREKKYARRLEPILSKHHLLLVTLLLFNALAMEALPLFLDRMVPEFLAIMLSVSFVLIFGEVVPQAAISKYGLAVGGNLAWLVRILMVLAFPIAWPASKCLDFVLGKDHSTYYKRAELKELVNIHAEGRGEGGILNADEISVIKGALELKEKSVERITTPLSKVFMLPLSGQMDERTMDEIVQNGHSRVPVYRNNRQDIVGLLLIKNLIKLDPGNPTPIADLQLRELPSVSNDTQLWDLLNMFQIGKSHMALVKRKLSREEQDQNNISSPSQQISLNEDLVLGVVTLEDIFEELIQEEIVDETDVFVDMQQQIRVADMFRRVSASMQRRQSSSSMIRLASSPSIPIQNRTPFGNSSPLGSTSITFSQ